MSRGTDDEISYRTDPSDGLRAMVVGPWAKDKHHYLRRYADIFSVGMKNLFPRRAYVDLFSGPGRTCDRMTGTFEDGSPLIGLGLGFTDHVYVELDEASAVALDQRCDPWKRDRFVNVLPGDCNQRVGDVINLLPERGLTLAFIDPTRRSSPTPVS